MLARFIGCGIGNAGLRAHVMEKVILPAEPTVSDDNADDDSVSVSSTSDESDSSDDSTGEFSSCG